MQKKGRGGGRKNNLANGKIFRTMNVISEKRVCTNNREAKKRGEEEKMKKDRKERG